MSLRAPSRFNSGSDWSNPVLDLLDHEIAAEKASALGRAGRRVAAALESLRTQEGGMEERERHLREAADAVYGYFVQRELCGLRRHDDAIREYAIPRQVLVRLGAK